MGTYHPIPPNFLVGKERQENEGRTRRCWVRRTKCAVPRTLTFGNDMKIPLTITWPNDWFIDATKPLAEIFASLNAKYADMWRGFNDTLRKHEKDLPSLLKVMIAHSWYPDFAIPIAVSRALETYARANTIDKIEEYLIAYYRTNAERIEKELVAAHSSRATILTEAFSVYRNKQYVFSIPVLLAQADGISEEILHKHFFRTGESIPAAKTKVNNLCAGNYALILLAPLIEKGTIRVHTNDLVGQKDYLNRHAIMHGSDLLYGTEKNALKCISLLSYLNAARHILNNEPNKRLQAIGAKARLMPDP